MNCCPLNLIKFLRSYTQYRMAAWLPHRFNVTRKTVRWDSADWTPPISKGVETHRIHKDLTLNLVRHHVLSLFNLKQFIWRIHVSLPISSSQVKSMSGGWAQDENCQTKSASQLRFKIITTLQHLTVVSKADSARNNHFFGSRFHFFFRLSQPPT